MTTSEDVYREFSADLTRVRRLLGLIGDFREFGASRKSGMAHESTPWAEADALLRTSAEVRTDLPLISGSLLLYCVGRFEFFARILTENAASEFAGLASTFDELPPSLRSVIRSKTLEICQAPSRFGYDELRADALLLRLAELMSGTVEVQELKSEVVSLTESNLRAEALAGLLKRVGVKDFWREVGKQAAIKLHLNVSDDGQCTKSAQAELDSIIMMRNQIAHPTSSTNFPDHEQVERHLSFLDKLAEVSSQIMDVHISVGWNSP